MVKAVIISGFLYDLSDNILPFLDTDTDLYVHTWQEPENGRWITKLNRYRKYCRSLKVVVEPFKYDSKLFSYFYSTWKVANSIDNIDQYNKVIKFKPNLDTKHIPYQGNIAKYFYSAKTHCRPLLDNFEKEDCIYGLFYHRTLDERMFTCYPNALRKAFVMDEESFTEQMYELNKELTSKYGTGYEGSIFWTEWFERRNIKLILDIDFKLTNNVRRD